MDGCIKEYKRGMSWIKVINKNKNRKKVKKQLLIVKYEYTNKIDGEKFDISYIFHIFYMLYIYILYI